MQQVKIFKSIETELEELESSINTWIRESGARIVSIHGNIAAQSARSGGTAFSASDVLVIVLYET